MVFELRRSELKVTTLSLLVLFLPLMAADNHAAKDAWKIQPLLVGADVPDVTVTTSAGESLELAKLASDQPAVLIFYRGNWCPICNKHLAELTPIVKDLEQAGFAIYAINQDDVATNAKAMKKQGFGFEVLSDADMEAARAFGLAFRVDDKTVRQYKGYGIDLVELYGRAQPELAVPAVWLVKDGKIHFSYVNPDYRERLAPRVIVAAAESLNQ